MIAEMPLNMNDVAVFVLSGSDSSAAEYLSPKLRFGGHLHSPADTESQRNEIEIEIGFSSLNSP